MGNADYVIRVSEAPSAVNPSAWDALLFSQNHPTPFMRHAYLAALHDSGSATPATGWRPHFFALHQGTELAGACVVYLKDHSYGEYVFDWAWASAYEQHGLPYYPKAVIAVPFTPVPGSRLLAKDTDARAALTQAVQRWCADQHISSAHMLFGSEADLQATDSAHWMQRHTVQFHWHNCAEGYANFDDFLASLNQEKRKKIKQERRKVAEAGVQFRHSRGAEISPEDWAFFYRCYANTYREHGNPPYLTPDFFQRMARQLPEHWLLFVAERNGRPIASSLIAIGAASVGADGTFESQHRVAYGRYWGALEQVDCLHFEACYYQPLAWCIANGYQRFEGGAQGEHKMARALLPTRTSSAHWLQHPAFADAVQRFLEREGDGIAQYLEHLEHRSPLKQAP
ncbi:MAG: GNAT family N-acetyltransferase [Rhodoferax sp.]|uniref:GNAT family N-acetyltransferase n=1 Tax=Rhodoferax sp. TaxID=50421 RepID=UPI002ACE2B36|nr:GNAT family N-acetyltransferase [Rhodoferax sp.]MDZ7891918.1 GNAT family N-acetyltransferase [Rhodoferax sp.]